MFVAFEVASLMYWQDILLFAVHFHLTTTVDLVFIDFGSSTSRNFFHCVSFNILIEILKVLCDYNQGG